MAMLDTTDIDFKSPGLPPIVEPNGWRKVTEADVGGAAAGIFWWLAWAIIINLSKHHTRAGWMIGVLIGVVVVSLQIRNYMIIRRKYRTGEEIQTGFWRRVSAKRGDA